MGRLAPLLMLVLLVASCRTSATTPDLINVLDVSPHRVEVGDQLELVGMGFPEGKAGTLTFRGTLHRPGREPVSVSAITTPLDRTTQNRVSLVFTEGLQAEFCGQGPDARHTTFRGDVVVAFAPRQRAAPPVTGTLRDVVLDVAPPLLARELEQELASRAEAAITFLGLALGPRDSRPGVVLAAVHPDGRAAQAGLQEEDRLLDFNGIAVVAAADLIPSPHRRQVKVTVKRGQLPRPIVRHIDVQGFTGTPPSELTHAAIVVGLAVAIVVLFMAPAAGLLTWAERLVARRLRLSSGRGRSGPRGFFAWLWHALVSVFAEDPLPAGGRFLVLRLVPYVMLLATTAAFTWLSLGMPLLSEDLDLGVLLTVSVTAVTTVGLILGGWRGSGRWSLWRGMRSAAQILCLQIPAFTGIAAVVLMTGSARFRDLVLHQGGLPWEWHLFKNPTLLVTFLLFLVPALPETSRAGAELPEADTDRARRLTVPNPASRCLMFFAEWGHVFVLSSFAAALFLGGWRLPVLSAAEQQASIALRIAGAALFQAKCWLLVLVVLWARWVLPHLRVDQMMGVCWRAFVPLSLATLGLTAAWMAGLRSAVLRSTQDTLSVVMFALAVFIAGYFVRRVLANLSSSEAQVSVNPWL